MASGAVDEAQNWEELTSSERSSYLSEYKDAGISLIVSAFGSTETPTSSGYDAVTTANTMAAWVIEYGFLGIDVDYEVLLRLFFLGDVTITDAGAWIRTLLRLILEAALRRHGSLASPSSFVQSFPREIIF